MAQSHPTPTHARRQRPRIYGRHGMCRRPEWKIWSSIKSRCLTASSSDYHNYGGRGIRVCERWQGPDGFANFYADMGPRPSPHHTIDRIDNDGPYTPENCRWATRAQQTINQRTNRLLTLNGQTKPLCVWAKEAGMTSQLLWSRLLWGWSLAEALSTPKRVLRRRN